VDAAAAGSSQSRVVWLTVGEKEVGNDRNNTKAKVRYNEKRKQY